jgi:oxygen-independent coproporphyrinogen-3 oxidase
MKKPLSIYIHIPFCERRCGYCDFYSTVGNDKIAIDGYVHRVCNEINGFAAPKKYIVKTVYIGGGTPSLLDDAHIFFILKTLREKFGIAKTAEVTIECNPNSLSEAKLRWYKEYGVNRISIGVQSFDDRILRRLGRTHKAARAAAAVKAAKKCFDNISVDLIVGVPNEMPYQIPPEILDIVTHISVYSLMKDDKPVQEDAIAFTLPNFKRYEVSNYAKRGYESKHNLVYWNGGEYIGFGAGAHSLLNNRRFNNSNDLFYVRENEYERTAEQIKTERISLGLRTARGIPCGLADGKQDEIALLLKQGLIEIKNNRITATEKGFQLLDQIIIKLV